MSKFEGRIVKHFAAIYTIYPLVKTSPVMTYGHQDIYLNRKPGEKYEMGSQTYTYEWPWYGSENFPILPNHKMVKFHCLPLEDMEEVDENVKPLKLKRVQGCQYVGIQTDASHLLKKDSGCFSFEVDNEIDDISENNDSCSEKESATQAFSSAKIKSSELEEKEVDVRVLEVRSVGISKTIAPDNEQPGPSCPWWMKQPPNFGQTKDVRFGNYSLACEVPKPVDYSKLEAMRDWSKDKDDWSKDSDEWPEGRVKPKKKVENPFALSTKGIRFEKK